MISKAWKKQYHVASEGDSVMFDCTTSDRNANVTLQYRYKHSNGVWMDIMHPYSSYSRYSTSSVLQLAQSFLFTEFRRLYGNLFRCIAEAHGNKICLTLGSLILFREQLYSS